MALGRRGQADPSLDLGFGGHQMREGPTAPVTQWGPTVTSPAAERGSRGAQTCCLASALNPPFPVVLVCLFVCLFINREKEE